MTSKYPDPPDIVTVYEFLDGTTKVRDIDGWQNVKCVLHADSKPSASLSTGEQKFKCYVCDIWGSGYDLIKLHQGITYWKAVEFARSNDLVPAATRGTGRSNGLLRKSNGSRDSSLSPGKGNHRSRGPWKPSWLGIGSDARS